MKTFRKIFIGFFALVLSMLFLVACGDKITVEDLQNLEFNDATFDYDGQPHSLQVENIYEDQGVTVTYEGNEVVIPGTFPVKAIIAYKELTVEKEAKITINKAESVLEAETVQKAYASIDGVSIQYTLNNTQQKLIVLNEYGKEVSSKEYSNLGTYNLEIYAKKNSIYKESNHIKITLHVVKSMFDISFNSVEIPADGTEKEYLISGTLPSGYTVEYKNNKATEVGNYKAEAVIKNDKGEVVETHRAMLSIVNPKNQEFEKFLDEFFVEYLEEDQLSVNIFCEKPENFGLEHYEAKWYTYESFGDEELQNDIEYFKELLAELQAFKDKKLSPIQEVAYETVEDFLEYYVEYYAIPDAFFMKPLYVDQFGGYVAEFNTYMEAYSLRTEKEVQDIVDYIVSTKDAFPSYLIYTQDKLDKGYPYSDYTLNEMRSFLKDVIDQGEEYYLIDIINAKIDAVDFLDAAKKEEYKTKVKNAVKEDFLPAVQELYEGLEKYLGKLAAEDEGYLTAYEKGLDLYLLELERVLGIEDLDIEAYIKELNEAIDSAIEDVISTQEDVLSIYGATNYTQFEAVLKNNSICKGTPEEMLEYLKEFAKSIVPELQSNPDIVVKEMDEASAKVSNAVAYYMKSALDNTGSEYITLNPVKLGNSTNNEVLGTLSHEGYPGHLYAYVYSKELDLPNVLTIMTSTAHGEGWATYVELKLYEYAKAHSSDGKFKTLMDYLYANQLSGFLLETRLDIAIHYQGWGASEIGLYMSELGYDSSSAGEIYNLLIETPASYPAYGYGKLMFYNLHEEAKEILGAYYDEVEFNAMLLSNGWTNLDLLQETYEEYMTNKCYEYNLEYVVK